MIDHNGSWLPSVWLGIPAIVLSVLLLTGLALWLILAKAEDSSEFWMIVLLWSISALPLSIVPLFSYWPYDGDYHRLQPATGVVKTIDTRFMAASQYVIITYDTGLTVRCDDSRCATVKVGDSLRLLCTKEFEWGTVNGWACKWGQS